jgi:SAM-dependent methyltransferase
MNESSSLVVHRELVEHLPSPSAAWGRCDHCGPVGDPLVAFAGPLPEGPVLDVGAGTGCVVAALRQAECARSITSTNVAELYLAFARERAECAGATFLQQDAASLDLPEDHFAGAFSCIVMNFLKEPTKALSELRRVVMSSGVIASAVWDFRGGLVYQRILWDTIASLDPAATATRDRIFSAPLGLPSGMVDLWRAEGLDDVTRESLTIHIGFRIFRTTESRCSAVRDPSAAMSPASICHAKPHARGRARRFSRRCCRWRALPDRHRLGGEGPRARMMFFERGSSYVLA